LLDDAIALEEMEIIHSEKDSPKMLIANAVALMEEILEEEALPIDELMAPIIERQQQQIEALDSIEIPALISGSSIPPKAEPPEG